MTISFNPQATTSPQNTFAAQTSGYVQGAFVDDPVAIQWLVAGAVASNASAPLWGGLPITETIAAANSNALGNIISAAGTIGAITGFMINNQAYNGIITPSSNVPLFTANMSVAFFRLGSGARLVVQVSAGAVASLQSQAINEQLGWDFTNNVLTTYSSGTALPVKLISLNTNSKIVSYNSGTGAANWTAGAAAVIQI